MNNTTINKQIKPDFIDYYDSRFSRIYYNPDIKTIICELKSEYVPIEHFKDTFYKVSELVEAGNNHKFIFDKRSLKAFHQPSMEWYFTVWKKEMHAKGLSIHRKILPPEPWFRKSVAIAKEQISREKQGLVLDLLDIQYCDSIQEAIEK